MRVGPDSDASLPLHAKLMLRGVWQVASSAKAIVDGRPGAGVLHQAAALAYFAASAAARVAAAAVERAR